MLGLIGRKCGMTRIFMENGTAIPVTVIEVEEHRVTQIKRIETDGYCAVQLATGSQKPSRINRPEAGHFAKANVPIARHLREFRVDDPSAFSVGDTITVAHFESIPLVDVTGKTKGKGFAGTVKRWGFRTQDASHGNSLSHRAPGSIGQNQTPGRVFKGKKMSGQLGCEQVTIQNLPIVRVDVARKLLLIKGAVPGFTGSTVIVKPAVKA